MVNMSLGNPVKPIFDEFENSIFPIIRLFKTAIPLFLFLRYFFKIMEKISEFSFNPFTPLIVLKVTVLNTRISMQIPV